MKKKILVVEDEPGIADTLTYTLDKEGFDSKRVATIADAKETLRIDNFSAIVLDVGLPDGSGFDFCREIRKSNDIPVLFLTARSDEIDKIVGLEIGADDYVTKPFSPREVVARLNAILRRLQKTKIATESASSFVVDSDKYKISYKSQNLDLSRYEFGILSLLLERKGQVYSRQQIMEKVWESPDMSLERTVDTHIKTIRAKLKKLSEKELLITHRGLGYSVKEEG